MTVMGCSGEGCKRFISISVIPGGNPVAKADPEQWATEYRICTACGAHFCDRCVKKMSGLFRKPKCSKCGGPLRRPASDEAFKY